jgi:WD40 repeat protein
MKRSENPTGWILIKAQVCSEWDSINGCIVQVNNEKLHIWNKNSTKDKEKSEFQYAHTAYYWSVDWILDDKVEELLGEDIWCHITITNDQMEELGRPEQRVDCEMVKMYGNATCCWIGYGKHTSEEFWTDSVSITDIMK